MRSTPDRVEDFVSVDGSPLALYLAIPAGDTPTLIHEAIPAGSRVLELGSGPGRLTRVLIAYGHQVTAVDDSWAMLDHVTGARRVRADLHQLDLNEQFDVVLAASHLINQPESTARSLLLDVCRRHVTGDGMVLLERYRPGWVATAASGTSQLGPVRMELEVGTISGGVRSAAVTYRLGDRSWRQEFSATDVDDEMLAREAAEHRLVPDRVLDEAATWISLRPAPDDSKQSSSSGGPGPDAVSE